MHSSKYNIRVAKADAPSHEARPHKVVYVQDATDAEKYRLWQAEQLLIEAGYVQDLGSGQWSLPEDS